MEGRGKKQVRLIVYDNEPMARLAEQRLLEQSIPCMIRSLGAGPGGWGVATNLPHGLYVKASDEMLAREVLGFEPAEIAEREEPAPQAPYRFPYIVAVFLIITAAALLFGVIELVIRRLI